jgi:type I restriction enzyme S subunit
VRYVSGRYGVIGTLNYLTAKSGYNLKYLYFCLRIFNFTPFITGLAIPHIYFRDYGNAQIYCPNISDQKRIAEELSNIERKIEIEKQILDKLKEQKNYLLSQMFI